jgi:hypothetical protein
MGVKNDRGTRSRTKRRFGLNRHRHGDEMSGETERVLASLREQEKITAYVRHRPSGKDDGLAARFSVTVRVSDRDVTMRFGVAITRREWQRAKEHDDDATHFCFPLGTRPDTIKRRILGLFSD